MLSYYCRNSSGFDMKSCVNYEQHFAFSQRLRFAIQILKCVQLQHFCIQL